MSTPPVPNPSTNAEIIDQQRQKALALHMEEHRAMKESQLKVKSKRPEGTKTTYAGKQLEFQVFNNLILRHGWNKKGILIKQ